MKVIPHIFEECIALILSGSPITKELRADEVSARFLSRLPHLKTIYCIFIIIENISYIV